MSFHHVVALAPRAPDSRYHNVNCTSKVKASVFLPSTSASLGGIQVLRKVNNVGPITFVTPI